MTFPAKITSDLAALNTGIAAVKPPKVTQAQVTVLKNASAVISADLTAAFKASDDALLVANNGLTAMTAQAALLKQQVTDTNQLLLTAQAALATANAKIAALETQIANQPPPAVLTTETQVLDCPAGQTGAIAQTRGVTAWKTTSNTCVLIPPVEPPATLVPSPNGTRGTSVVDSALTTWTLGNPVPDRPGEFELLRDGVVKGIGKSFLVWRTAAGEIYFETAWPDHWWGFTEGRDVGPDPTLGTPTPPPNQPPVEPPPVVVPPVPSSQPGLTIIPHPSVPRWAQGMKHVTATFHPPSGRIYYNNGDYRGYDNKYEMSYQQETGSFDIAIILAQGPNAPDAFRLEYPYEGFGGTTAQPKHPDFCALPWDELRNKLWSIPGQTANSSSNAPGETASGTDDPCFKNGIWQFDPNVPMAAATPRWNLISSDYGTGFSETWMAVRDPLKDRFIRCGQEYINILDAKTGKWEEGAGATADPPKNWYPLLGGIRSISKEYLAVDIANRKFYAMDSVLKKCFCISMDEPFAVEDCGEQPGAKLPFENYEYMVFNSNHNLLEYNNEQEAAIYVAKADVRPLVWKKAATGVWSRAAVYDPKNDGSLWFGGLNDAAGGGNPNMYWFKAMESIAMTDPGHPPATGTVSWAPESGHVVEVPSKNTMRSIMYGTPAGPGSGNGLNYFANWCSGVYAWAAGPYGWLVFCNGGDADYWGTEVLAFMVDELCEWKRLNERATNLNGKLIVGQDPNYDEYRGEHISPDGSRHPSCPHGYDGAGYLPPEMGGGLKGSFLYLMRTICYGPNRSHFHPHALDLETGQWRMASATPAILQQPDTAMGYNAAGSSWALDRAKRRYWGILSNTSPIANDFIWWQDFDSAGMATAGRQQLTEGYQTLDRYSTMIRWGDNLVAAGMRNGVFAVDFRPATDWTNFKPVTLTGDVIPPSNGPGLAFLNGKLYVRTSEGYRQNMWEISPDWSVRKIEMLGVTVAAKDNPNGMWKRLMAVEALGLLMWVDDVDGPVYAFKP